MSCGGVGGVCREMFRSGVREKEVGLLLGRRLEVTKLCNYGKGRLYLGGSDSPGQRPLCADQELLTISESKSPGHFSGARADRQCSMF